MKAYASIASPEPCPICGKTITPEEGDFHIIQHLVKEEKVGR